MAHNTPGGVAIQRRRSKNMKKSVMFTLLGMAALLALASCGGTGSQGLAGKWLWGVSEDGNTRYIWELGEDGTGKDHYGQSLTWKTENNRLYITQGEAPAVEFEYKLRGKTLTLTPLDDGENAPGEAITMQREVEIPAPGKEKSGPASKKAEAGQLAALTGKWAAVDGNRSGGSLFVLELFTNGSGMAGVIDYGYGRDFRLDGLSWTAENGRLLLTRYNNGGRMYANVYSYEVSGQTLHLQDDYYYESLTFMKQ
jgi:hypothetical protein